MVMENKAFTRKVLMVCILLVCSTHAMYAQSFLKKLGKAVERELFSPAGSSDGRRDVSATKVTSPDPEVKVELRDCEQSGEFVKISLLIINQSQLEFALQLEADDGESIAFDPEGNVYKRGIIFKFGGQQGDVAQCFLPRDTPVKCLVSIPVEEPIDLLTKVIIFCRGINATLEKDQLQLTNVPVMHNELTY